jgi:hypothetical protein
MITGLERRRSVAVRRLSVSRPKCPISPIDLYSLGFSRHRKSIRLESLGQIGRWDAAANAGFRATGTTDVTSGLDCCRRDVLSGVIVLMAASPFATVHGDDKRKWARRSRNS